jgi:hypothetical protein
MSSAIAALTDKGFADLYPEDGPTVDGGDNVEARGIRRLPKVRETGCVLLFRHRWLGDAPSN